MSASNSEARKRHEEGIRVRPGRTPRPTSQQLVDRLRVAATHNYRLGSEEAMLMRQAAAAIEELDAQVDELKK